MAAKSVKLGNSGGDGGWRNIHTNNWSTHMSLTGRIVCLQRSHRKFVIVMCMMIEIQDLEGV